MWIIEKKITIKAHDYITIVNNEQEIDVIELLLILKKIKKKYEALLEKMSKKNYYNILVASQPGTIQLKIPYISVAIY